MAEEGGAPKVAATVSAIELDAAFDGPAAFVNKTLLTITPSL